MPTYAFREAADLTPPQVDQINTMGATDPKEPFFPAGIETYSLFGYIDTSTNEVVAWAWGSKDSTMGELHVYVLPGHRGHDLASRIALRYLLRRNETVTEFSFVVTNVGLVAALRSLGFKGHPTEKEGHVRAAFGGQDLMNLQQQAEALNALASSITL